MNDFTKDELEHLYDALWTLSKLGWVKSDLRYCKKIQSMIDNYCEHEFSTGCSVCSGVASIECIHCNKELK